MIDSGDIKWRRLCQWWKSWWHDNADSNNDDNVDSNSDNDGDWLKCIWLIDNGDDDSNYDNDDDIIDSNDDGSYDDNDDDDWSKSIWPSEGLLRPLTLFWLGVLYAPLPFFVIHTFICCSQCILHIYCIFQLLQ